MMTGNSPPTSMGKGSSLASANKDDTNLIIKATDLTTLASLDEIEYANTIKKFRKSLVQGDVLSYHKANIQLPTALQGSRPTKTIDKIIAFNPQLKQNDWSAVSADINGGSLTLKTFCIAGLFLL